MLAVLSIPALPTGRGPNFAPAPTPDGLTDVAVQLEVDLGDQKEDDVQRALEVGFTRQLKAGQTLAASYLDPDYFTNGRGPPKFVVGGRRTS